MAAPDGPVEVLHRSSVAVYLDVAGQCVGLVAAGAVELPIALRVIGSVVSLGGGTPYIEGGVLRWGHTALVTRRLVEVRAPRIDLARTPGTKTGPVADVDVHRSPAAGPVTLPGRVLPGWVTPDTVPAFVGRGDGLTPLGDDVLCGWLAGHRAARVATPEVDAVVRRHLGRTTTLSAALLEAALLGEVCTPVADHLRALGTDRADATRGRLLAVGHTSGAGLAHGIDLALTDLARARSAA